MPLRLLRWSLTACAFTVAFVINPMFVAGCISGDDDEPSDAELAKIEVGLIERLDEVNGQDSFPFTHDGVQYEVLLALDQRKQAATAKLDPTGEPWTSTAHACGSKTFYASASACSTHYQLAVEGTLTLRRLGTDEGTIEGDIPVRGTLDDTTLDLALDGDRGSLYFDLDQKAATLRGLQATDLGTEKLDIDYP